eukprot:sb/3474163/
MVVLVEVVGAEERSLRDIWRYILLGLSWRVIGTIIVKTSVGKKMDKLLNFVVTHQLQIDTLISGDVPLMAGHAEESGAFQHSLESRPSGELMLGNLKLLPYDAYCLPRLILTCYVLTLPKHSLARLILTPCSSGLSHHRAS